MPVWSSITQNTSVLNDSRNWNIGNIEHVRTYLYHFLQLPPPERETKLIVVFKYTILISILRFEKEPQTSHFHWAIWLASLQPHTFGMRSKQAIKRSSWGTWGNKMFFFISYELNMHEITWALRAFRYIFVLFCFLIYNNILLIFYACKSRFERPVVLKFGLGV